VNILLVGRNAQIGGGSTFRLNIGGGLRRRGHRVAVAAMPGPMVARYREAGLDFLWTVPGAAGAWLLARALRAREIDLVHASNTTAGDQALAACRAAGVPLVVSLHNTIADHEARHECLKAARKLIVFDAGAEASAAAFTHEFDTAKLVRLPRPVPHAPLGEDQLEPGSVAYVGRLSSRKGRVALALLEGFAQVASTHAGWKLVVIGDGSLRAAVCRRAKELSRAGVQVECIGPALDPRPLLGGCGVVVGAGYAALEAVMQGRAVIGAGFHGFGPVHAANLTGALAANFGDTRGAWEMSPAGFAAALQTVRSAWTTPSMRGEFWGLDRLAAPVHAVDAVVPALERVYRQVLGAGAERVVTGPSSEPGLEPAP
jgi:glycosyltransferase involved in cell wall biosynthesis